MYAAVDAPKSKQITIAYLSLKTTAISWLLFSSLPSATPSCPVVRESEIYSLFILFYKLGFILDMVSILYFLLRDQFSRLQFYVYYFVHLTSLLVMGLGLLIVPNEDFDFSCPAFMWVRISYFVVRLLFFANTLAVMCLNLYTGLRLSHCGANIEWTVLWLMADDQTKSKAQTIGLFHAIMGLTAVLVLMVVQLNGKIKFSASLWRSFIKVASAGLFLLWVYTLVSRSSKNLYIQTYVKLGLGELVSPFLYLVFMNTEQGDPRERVMTAFEGIFGEGREGYKLQYQQTL